MAEVRVRIAPSPTGPPHVGTAYIALFNYAFARANQGKFLLRIEDTDRNRYHPQYETAILKALKWLDIHWDEGPDIGGDYGPYQQSKRTEHYQHYIERLLIKDGAYRCFCTPERLEKMRAEQKQRKQSPQYDGKCRHISGSVLSKKLKDKTPFVVRLKVPKRGKCTFEDRFRGKIIHPYKEVDDQVLLKSDGLPTYHLANVVDDHLMKITHVIRGEEWLSSTPKHVLLYDFLGFDKPEFIHMPLLLNPDGSKLSKRKNPTSIFYYQDAGFLPQAVVNYLSLMGYSRPNGEEKFTLEEMIADFDIDRISLGGSVFDVKKLSWLSGKYIREDLTPEILHQKLIDWRMNPRFFAKVVEQMHPRMETLGDFMPIAGCLWAREVDYDGALLVKSRTAEETIKILQSFLFLIEESPDWNAAFVEEKIHQVANIWEWKIREVTHPLFVAVSGRKVAPPLYMSLEFLGKDITRTRILHAIEKLGGLSKKKLKALEKEWMELLKNNASIT